MFIVVIVIVVVIGGRGRVLIGGRVLAGAVVGLARARAALGCAATSSSPRVSGRP